MIAKMWNTVGARSAGILVLVVRAMLESAPTPDVDGGGVNGIRPCVMVFGGVTGLPS